MLGLFAGFLVWAEVTGMSGKFRLKFGTFLVQGAGMQRNW